MFSYNMLGVGYNMLKLQYNILVFSYYMFGVLSKQLWFCLVVGGSMAPVRARARARARCCSAALDRTAHYFHAIYKIVMKYSLFA